MSEFKSLQDVMNSTDDTTRELLRKILSIEKEYEHLQTLSQSTEIEISEKIVKQIIQELK